MKHLQFCRFVLGWIVILMTVNLEVIVSGNVKELIRAGNNNTCGTHKCTKEVWKVYSNVKTSVDPCKNFFRYTCRRWMHKNKIPDGETMVSQRGLLVINRLEQLLKWLNEAMTANKRYESQTLQKVVDYYRSCTELDKIDARGLGPLKTAITVNGGWPLSLPKGSWNIARQNLTLQKIHRNYLNRLEVSALFEFDVRPFNDTVHLLHFVQPKRLHEQPGGPRYFFVSQIKNSHDWDDEFDYVQKMARIIAKDHGQNPSNIKIRRHDVEKMLKLKKSLMELYSIPKETETRTDHVYARRTIGQIQNTWNREIGNRSEYAINWLRTIRSAFKRTNITVQIWDQVVLKPENIISKLAKMLIEFSLETVVNYVNWAVIPHRAMYTHKRMRETVDVFATHRYQHDDVDDYRSHRCFEQHKMDVGLSYVYAKTFFSGNHRSRIREIVSEIKEQMMSHVDPEVMEQSKNKVEMLMKNIGYPSWYDDDGKMDDYHRELVVKPDAYFENVISYDRFRRNKSLKKLRQPYDKHEARSDFVAEGLKAMNFQKPFFDFNRNLAMVYGAIGGLAGYELARLLLTKRQLFDVPYREQALCFTDKYSRSVLYRDRKVNGAATIVQDIADYTGFTAALRAFVTHKKKNNVRKRHDPPSVRHPDDRLFFYSLAERFCESLSTKHRAALAMNENIEHSPNDVRINVALSNIQQFSDAFQCKPGSRMNPVRKCHYWN